MKSALIDLAALECLDAFPHDLDRLLVVVQISPWRREALQRAFSSAEIIESWPPGDGPWQGLVDAGLASLPAGDVTAHGVPVLECFRESWRGELERIAIAARLDGGEWWVASGSPWEVVVAEIARQRPEPLLFSAGHRQTGTASLLGKLRTVNSRGLRLALVSRLDPTGLRRAALTRRSRVADAEVVVVSSYVNTTRAALRLWRELGAANALLVETGPGAVCGLTLPKEWARASIPALLSSARRSVSAEVSARQTEATRVLAGWKLPLPGDESLSLWPLLVSGAFGSRLLDVHLPEVVATLAALRHAFERTGARMLITANEFSFCDRAALLLARATGIRSEVVQHGVIDGHYRRDEVLTDRYWCWDEAARQLMARWGASRGEGLATLTGTANGNSTPAPRGDRHALVLFTQPYELIPLRREDLLDEVVPVLDHVSKARGWSVVVKTHPLESAATYKSRLQGLSKWRVTASEPADSILPSARAAIVLDSSVVVDCRRHGVPCFGIGWYEGHYGRELEAMAYLRRAENPKALEVVLSETA